MDLLDENQERAVRQLENISGIKGKIRKEELKTEPNPKKLENWNRELRLTENAFQRMQVLI